MLAGKATAAVAGRIAFVVLATDALVLAVVFASVHTRTDRALREGFLGTVEVVVAWFALTLGVVVVIGVEYTPGVRVAIQTHARVNALAGVGL